jgi:putative transcriptional regulator
MSAPTTHIDERIADLLLGDVSDAERAELEAHAAGCKRCGDELTQAADAFAALALALPAEPAPPALRERLLADARPPRLAAMIDKLAACFDVTRAKARALLDRLDDPAAWMPGPVPDSWVILTDGGGPKLGGAFCGFVKMGAGVRWPKHKHLGTEHMLVLQGGFRQDDGFEVHPGQLHVMEPGTAHGFDIFDDEPCTAAVVLWGPVEFEDPSVSLGDLLK